MLNALLRLGELSCRKVIVILIGEQGWDTFVTRRAERREEHHFPAYTKESSIHITQRATVGRGRDVIQRVSELYAVHVPRDV